jgi:amino acid transporter
MPLLVAVFIIVFFTGLLLKSAAYGQEGGDMLPLVVMVIGGLGTAISLIWWLLTPLEEEH